MKNEENNLESKLIEIFSHDLTEEIAGKFLGQLFTLINDNGSDPFISGGKCYQEVIDKTYGPIIKGFAEKIYEVCEEKSNQLGKEFIKISPTGDLSITVESFGQMDKKEIFNSSIEMLKKDLAKISKGLK